MKRILFAISLFLLPAAAAFSQDNTVVTIGDEKVSLPEFERVYFKNNSAGTSVKQTPEEYMDLFINFKLKVIEAENLGMDTLVSFKNELKGYRDQLAKPYLNDSSVAEEMAKQEYERMKTELHILHILLKIDPKKGPADTLRVWNQLMDLRKRAIKGEDFQKLALQYSEDPSLKMNKGDIGWMTAFRTVWDFENAIYNTPVGQISMPIRTQYGYHIAKVTETRPSKGSVQVYHIFVRAPEEWTAEQKLAAKNKIYAIYDSLKNGHSFGEMVRNNSDDRSTVSKSGELPWFGAGQMIPEFENAAFSLSHPGEYTQPVQSFYGWHLLMLKGRKDLGSYSEMRSEIISKINDPQVAAVKKANYINKLKKQYNYTLNQENFDKFCSRMDTSYFYGTWSDETFRSDMDVLFSIADQKTSIADFAAYLYKMQRKTSTVPLQPFLQRQLDSYSGSVLQDFEKSTLPDRYPEFKYILQEYHDGILLFDLTDKMVWSKAMLDTLGLEKYYNEHKNSYMWGDRVDAMIFKGDSAQLVDQARSLAVKYGKKKTFTKDFVLDKVCAGDSTKSCISISEALYEKGENEDVDKTNWVAGAGQVYKTDKTSVFVFVKNTVKPEIKKLDEARGLVISDYQNYLEKQWIDELRVKYPVKVNQELLKTIKQ
jgi:peptidyl-prolyl cis-trans isomerase SurA